MWADGRTPSTTLGVRKDKHELARLQSVQKRRDRRDVPRVDWLDAHVDRQINQREHAQAGGDEMILYVDLPTYSMPVVYAESDGKSTQDIATPQESVIEPSIFTIFDPEAASENLFEAKHRRLVRSQHASLADRERKPTAAVRDALMVRGG